MESKPLQNWGRFNVSRRETVTEKAVFWGSPCSLAPGPIQVWHPQPYHQPALNAPISASCAEFKLCAQLLRVEYLLILIPFPSHWHRRPRLRLRLLLPESIMDYPDYPHPFTWKPPRESRVESVRVTADRPGFRLQQPQLADLVKDRFFGDRTLFAYSHLPEGHIRLVIVRRGKFSDPLECDLISLSLLSLPIRQRPYYEALSYEWGNGPPVHKIRLRDFTTDLRNKSQDERDPKRLRATVLRKVGANFFVRENLFQALHHLRRDDQDVAMWNDAICLG